MQKTENNIKQRLTSLENVLADIEQLELRTVGRIRETSTNLDGVSGLLQNAVVETDQQIKTVILTMDERLEKTPGFSRYTSRCCFRD